MTTRIREGIDAILPATVTDFDVLDDFDHDNIPVLQVVGMTLEITGPFVGRQGHESLWDEVEPEALSRLLQGFVGQSLLAIQSGEGWLHLAFTNGWLRVVATDWDSWIMTLPEVTWMGHGRSRGTPQDETWVHGSIVLP
ncbi:hypothetical protein [Propionibacterium australiense]|uniref:hypothetical protein n=1 Tax=Propionibacterium australiense TaxID=119981 RepID=UPI000F839702|nr:hypothetical protein [Propionibacterium australiense]